MHWKRKSKQNLNGVYSKHSLSKKLKEEGKSSDEFEVWVGRLTIEELIALKLEVSARILGGKLYGFNLWSAMPKIAAGCCPIKAYSRQSYKLLLSPSYFNEPIIEVIAVPEFVNPLPVSCLILVPNVQRSAKEN
jgi:hypothetical protein